MITRYDDALPQLKKPNKYGAVRTVVDGIVFASKMEARRYALLNQAQQQGRIEDLSLQPKFPIHVNGRKVCTVILDFLYYDKQTGQQVYEDVKGRDNALSRLKRKLVEASYNITVSVVCQ